MEWVSIENRFPTKEEILKNKGFFLTYSDVWENPTENKFFIEGEFDEWDCDGNHSKRKMSNMWGWEDDEGTHFIPENIVTHWMPLPPCPK